MSGAPATPRRTGGAAARKPCGVNIDAGVKCPFCNRVVLGFGCWCGSALCRDPDQDHWRCSNDNLAGQTCLASAAGPMGMPAAARCPPLRSSLADAAASRSACKPHSCRPCRNCSSGTVSGIRNRQHTCRRCHVGTPQQWSAACAGGSAAAASPPRWRASAAGGSSAVSCGLSGSWKP